MPPLMYQIAGGMFFIPAALVLAAAVLARSFARHRWFARLCVTVIILAIATITISAAAMPWWFYICWAVLTVAWFCVSSVKRRRVRIALGAGVVIWSLAAASIEFFAQRLVPLPQGGFSRLYVFGDSLTAGMGRAGESTWPTMLQASHGVRIIDLSRAGCTVEQAIPIAERAAPHDGIVLIELGGNDLIGQAGADRFGAALDRLVQSVQGPGRELVMFELPLFPFDNAYGIEQRRIASKYKVRLIPRRSLAAILASPGATVDGIHLSNAGQRQMADLVREVVAPALRTGETTTKPN
jgi:lysophospholipase L1-like esterase